MGKGDVSDVGDEGSGRALRRGRLGHLRWGWTDKTLYLHHFHHLHHLHHFFISPPSPAHLPSAEGRRRGPGVRLRIGRRRRRGGP
jgi:hypothetical protein